VAFLGDLELLGRVVGFLRVDRGEGVVDLGLAVVIVLVVGWLGVGLRMSVRALLGLGIGV
jgi:hypothetical protein